MPPDDATCLVLYLEALSHECKVHFKLSGPLVRKVHPVRSLLPFTQADFIEGEGRPRSLLQT